MPRNQKFILLADDDREDIELLEEAILQIEPDTKIHSVINGSMVLDFLESCQELPNLIILDYNMSEMNGAEVLLRLGKNSRFENIPKIIWSTSNNEAFVRECMERGASAYLVKPSTNQQLQQQARQVLGMCKVSAS